MITRLLIVLLLSMFTEQTLSPHRQPSALTSPNHLRRNKTRCLSSSHVGSGALTTLLLNSLSHSDSSGDKWFHTFISPKQRGGKGKQAKPGLGRRQVGCLMRGSSPTAPSGSPDFSLPVLRGTAHTGEQLTQVTRPWDSCLMLRTDNTRA